MPGWLLGMVLVAVLLLGICIGVMIAALAAANDGKEWPGNEWRMGDGDGR